jgi:hypothetical protein
MKVDLTRAEFHEAFLHNWAEENGLDYDTLIDEESGEYRYSQINIAWEAWKKSKEYYENLFTYEEN